MHVPLFAALVAVLPAVASVLGKLVTATLLRARQELDVEVSLRGAPSAYRLGDLGDVEALADALTESPERSTVSRRNA